MLVDHQTTLAQNRIIGGYQTNIERFPYMVRINLVLWKTIFNSESKNKENTEKNKNVCNSHSMCKLKIVLLNWIKL